MIAQSNGARDVNARVTLTTNGDAGAVGAARDAGASYPLVDAEAALAPNTAQASAVTDNAAFAIDTADRRKGVRWFVSCVFVIAAHVAIVFLMVHYREELSGASQPADPIMIDLAPVVRSPATVPDADSLPAPDQAQDAPDKIAENLVPDQPMEQPIPDDKPTTFAPEPLREEAEPQVPQEMKLTAPEAPVVAELPPKPKNVEKRQKPVEPKRQVQHVQSRDGTAKPDAAKPSPVASSRSQATGTAAESPSGSPRGGLSVADWRSQVIGILERNKRYPAGAQANNEQGAAHLAFTVNRQGHVTSAHVAGSSGSAALDAETVSLAHRVSFPPPPPDLAGAQISLMVTLHYNMR